MPSRGTWTQRKALPAAGAAVALLACLAALLAAASGGAAERPPRGFFGIAPQAGITPLDARYMRAGGIETVRWPLAWSTVQPTRRGGYDWSSFDPVVETAARAGLRVMPVVASPPRWVVRRETTLPVDTAVQRRAVRQFLQAAVRRYGPGGELWRERAVEGPNYEPAITRPVPIREWQVWNEVNFFYFAFPVSVPRYARLLSEASRAIKAVDPGARVILSGLFGEPNARGRRGMPAARFLDRLYKVPGIRHRFDGIALHPYAVDAKALERLVEEFVGVARANRDRVPLYVTEIGWGSENNFRRVAFEQGIRGQVRQLRASYRYLLDNRRRLNLRQVVWFSWKDLKGSCTFCDSVGFFRDSPRMRPKPAWHAFVKITGGRPRP